MRTWTKYFLMWCGFMAGNFIWDAGSAQMSFQMAPVLMAPTTITTHPFNTTVGHWSRELKDIPKPEGSTGNCLPVAVELQKRIVRTGRMAIIVSVDPTPSDNISHAVVVYDSDLNGRFDSFADNGYLTKWVPKPSGPLMRGHYGKYEGRCIEPSGGRCRLTGTLF